MDVAVNGTSEMMTEKQFLQKIKASRGTLHKWKKQNLISHYKAGRKLLYDERSIQDFKNNCTKFIAAKSKTNE